MGRRRTRDDRPSADPPRRRRGPAARRVRTRLRRGADGSTRGAHPHGGQRGTDRRADHASRVRGGGRLVEGLPRRVVLGFPSRAEHVAAGGDGHSFAARPPGRGMLDGLETQFGWTPHDAGAAETSPEPAAWLPARHTAVIARDPHGVRARLQEAWTGTGVPVLLRADAAASGDPALEDPRRVVVGEPAHWQAHWRDLQRAIAEGQVVVDADCPDALRVAARRAGPRRPGRSRERGARGSGAPVAGRDECC